MAALSEAQLAYLHDKLDKYDLPLSPAVLAAKDEPGDRSSALNALLKYKIKTVNKGDNEIPDVRANSELAPLIAELCQADRLKFKRDWSRGMAMELPELSKLRTCGVFNAERLKAAAAAGDNQTVTEALSQNLKLAGFLLDDHLIISALCAGQIISDTANAAAPVLHKLSTGELAELQTGIAAIKEKYWVACDAAIVNDTLNNLNSNPEELAADPYLKDEAVKAALRNMGGSAEITEKVIDLTAALLRIRTTAPRSWKSAAVKLVERAESGLIADRTAILLSGPLDRILNQELKIWITLNMLEAAVNAEIEYQKTGQYPAVFSVDDPMTGRPFVRKGKLITSPGVDVTDSSDDLSLRL